MMLVLALLCVGCGKKPGADDPMEQYRKMQEEKADAALLQQADRRTDVPDLIFTDCREECPMTGNPNDVLCVPTQMTKIGEDYFLVDCYHNTILTSRDVNAPLPSWKVLTDQINMGHTIAGDGTVYLADDTENNRVLVFVKDGDGFFLVQTIENVGVRPHYIRYLKDLKQFWCLSSLTGEIYIFETVPTKGGSQASVKLREVRRFDFLDGIYVRTFTPLDDRVYLPAGDGMIYCMDYDFTIAECIGLPPELGGPTQLAGIGDKYYMTVSTDIFGTPSFANLVCADSLSDFGKGNYTSLREKFCEDGTPYLITAVDDGYYLALHSDIASHCMWSFGEENGELTRIKAVFSE